MGGNPIVITHTRAHAPPPPPTHTRTHTHTHEAMPTDRAHDQLAPMERPHETIACLAMLCWCRCCADALDLCRCCASCGDVLACPRAVPCLCPCAGAGVLERVSSSLAMSWHFVMCIDCRELVFLICNRSPRRAGWNPHKIRQIKFFA
jgi:hypothetical protein